MGQTKKALLSILYSEKVPKYDKNKKIEKKIKRNLYYGKNGNREINCKQIMKEKIRNGKLNRKRNNGKIKA